MEYRYTPQFAALEQQIRQKLVEQAPLLLAIDGPCGAGKTTLARMLSEIFGCNIFHMDDFFLRPHQRTAARLAEPGGNVDYERFYQEVLLPLKTGEAFSYRPYDCKTGSLRAPVPVAPSHLNIIEGSYSMHPHFGECYDLKVFLTVSPDLQKQRILQRPAFLQARFFEEWIPMERRYFETFTIEEQSDILWHADWEVR